MNQILTTAENRSSPTTCPSTSTKPLQLISVHNTNSTRPFSSPLSDTSVRKLSDGKVSVYTLKETLDELEEYSMSYELDCRGWCEMPVLFHASLIQVTHNIFFPEPDIFTCKTFLPGSCECGSETNYEIEFSLKTEKNKRLLRLKPGVYSKSWCASNDKMDVYNVVDNQEHHLGFIVIKTRFCGNLWEINDEKEKVLYTIKQYKGFFCSCSNSEIKYRIEPIGKDNVEGSITKKSSCCCVNKSNPDDCIVKFPKESDWKAKALIISACIWLYKDIFLRNSCVF